MATTKNTLGNGETMTPGTSLWSLDRKTEFRMQTDGKIAVYWEGVFKWQNTAEQEYDINDLIMQDDGNLCIYNKDSPPKATWASGTYGNKDVILAVQNDGNVVLYKGTPIWATNTVKG